MGWSATELHQQGHTELCQKTSSLCDTWGRTLWITSSNKMFSQGFELLASCDRLKCQMSVSSFDFNTSTMMKIVIFIVTVLHGSVVLQLRCSGYIVYHQIQRSVRIKQLQEFLKSDHWLQRYCILSRGYFILSHPVYVNFKVNANIS